MDHFTQRVLLIGRVVPRSVKLLGTGFFVGGDGRIVTSRHVIGNDTAGLVVIPPHINSIQEYQDVGDIYCRPATAVVQDVNPIADLAILKIDAKITDCLDIGGLDEVGVGESLDIYGFPHCVDGRRVLTYQSAALGAKVLLPSSSLKIKHGVVNSQTRPGQSGSMVFSSRLNKVVGLLQGTYVGNGPRVDLIGLNPTELNQTSHIVSAEYIRDML
ncbi:S1 family peptidase [Pseudomonas putida]|uniref:S1 family peptidase n=1 Tax=Pseudomonas putida TaxID=303 RepID=UPI0009BE5D88|nr:serine protease [Pseudomonas putida]